MAAQDIFADLDPGECRLMPEDLVKRYNALVGVLRIVRAAVPSLAQVVGELTGELPPKDKTKREVTLPAVRARLTRERLHCGFLGRTQIGKSTTFDNILGVVEDKARRPSEVGPQTESTTSVVTRLRAVPDGNDEIELRFVTEERYRFKRDAVCEAVGLKIDADDLSDETVLQNLPEVERRIAQGEARALTEDPKYLRKLIGSHQNTQFQKYVGGPPRKGNYAERFTYLNHNHTDPSPSPYVLLEDALIRFRTDRIHPDLEIIDLPGLGAHVTIDTVLSEEFLRDLDGALVFVSLKASPDNIAGQKVIPALREQFRGDFEGRVWLVFTNFDSLSGEFVQGTGFDGLVRMATQFQVPRRQVCLVSNYLSRSGVYENCRLRRDWAVRSIGFPPDPLVPPQVEQYPELVPAYEALLTDGGIGRLRHLLRETLAPQVAGRLRQWVAQRLADLAGRLVPPLELARRRSGEDLLPDVNQCLEAVHGLLVQLGGRTDFFNDPARQLQQDLLQRFTLRLPPGEFYDSLPFPAVRARFPDDADFLEASLIDQVKTAVLPRLYGEAAGALGGLPELPVGRAAGVLPAWQAFGQTDAEKLEDWKGPLFPTFLAPDLFSRVEDCEAELLNGKRYRALLEEKISVSARQALHVLRQRLLARLVELVRDLDDLSKVRPSANGPAARVDYDNLLGTLRTLCPST